MGFGLPAALAAKLGYPDRGVVALIGDSGFAMTATELAVAAELGLGIVVVVFADGSLNRIELKQMALHYPSTATRIEPTDLAAMATAMHCDGVQVNTSAELEKAWPAATGSPGPCSSRPISIHPSTNPSSRVEWSPVILQHFAAFAVGQRASGLPEPVYGAATRAVLDWFAATVPGSTMPPAQILRAALVDDDTASTAGGRGARLVPDGRQVPVRTAALINATASHTAELDDIFRAGIYHPGSPTVGAAFALAEHLGASGRDLLRAVAIGYEIGDRIATAIQPAHYTYWHTTGTVGTIGATAAAAELLQLDEERFIHAMATATTLAAGLQQAFRSDAMSKPLHAGHAAEAGLLAALSARHGYTGAPDILEGAAGFGAAMSDGPDWSAAAASLGTDWGICQPTVKNYSCCGHTFAAVDAALALRDQGLHAASIRQIRVATYDTALKVAGKTELGTAFEAKFSTGYCVAAALLLGSVRLRAFEEPALADPELRALAAKVTLEADPLYSAAFPGRRAARVTLVGEDGVEHSHERLTRKGDPEDPLTDADLDDKFTDLAEPVLGMRRTARLRAALWALPDAPDVRALDLTADA